MGYNQDLEKRIDRLSGQLGDLTRKRMFGGVGYLWRGNMCFGIYKESLVLRITPEKAADLLKDPSFSPFDMTGRAMKGWVLAAPEKFQTDGDLLKLLNLGLDFVKTLPEK